MKATGIVRRIDDLGRVVIPKEIRRTMRIREGDPLEIYTSAGEAIQISLVAMLFIFNFKQNRNKKIADNKIVIDMYDTNV